MNGCRIWRTVAYVPMAFGLFLSCRAAAADRIDDYVRAQMRTQHIPGLSLAVVRDGTVVKEAGYGFSDVERHVPARPDTVYQLASLTKQFTASGILLLAQEHRIRLDDPISQYVADTPAHWRAVTIRECLTNTSGIPDGVNDLHATTRNGTSPAEIVGALAHFPLHFPPGTDWHYSNTNFMLLAMVIQRVTGQSYDRFLAARVFRRLGMTTTRRDSMTGIIPNRAAGYTWTGNALENSVDLDPTLWENGEAGIVSDVVDLAKWDTALSGGLVLDGNSRTQMWSPVLLADGARFPYGFGWFVIHDGDEWTVSHTGSGREVSASFVRFLSRRLSVIVLANLSGANASVIAFHVGALADPTLAATPHATTGDPQPRVTAVVREFITRGQAGRLVPAQFTAQSWQEAGPAGGAFLRSLIGPYGPPHRFVFQEQTPAGANTRYRYLVRFRDGACVFDCTLTPEGKFVEGGLTVL